MSRILVAYGSRHGSTAEIAERIGEVLTRRGADVTVVSAEQAGPPDSYDAVVAGSGVYIRHWLEPARDFVREHTAALKSIPVWLFSSGPLGDPEHLLPEGDPVDVTELAEASDATGTGLRLAGDRGLRGLDRRSAASGEIAALFCDLPTGRSVRADAE